MCTINFLLIQTICSIKREAKSFCGFPLFLVSYLRFIPLCSCKSIYQFPKTPSIAVKSNDQVSTEPPKDLPTTPALHSVPLPIETPHPPPNTPLRRRSQQYSRTSTLTRSKRRITGQNRSRSRRPSRSAPGEARGTIASHDDSGAPSLADSVANRTRVGDAVDGNESGGDECESEETHGGDWEG